MINALLKNIFNLIFYKKQNLKNINKPIKKLLNKEIDFHILNQFIPNGSFYLIIPYFENHKFDLIITRERKTILGNYSYNSDTLNHKITINGNLNKQAFLVTLLHEIAHLITFKKYHNSVLPHGQEWKNIYKEILSIFISKKIFYEDVEKQLLISISNLKASSCGDINLATILKKYDEKINDNIIFIKDLKVNEKFIYENKEFKMIQKLKKRYKCEEIKTKNIYLFYALAEVTKINIV